MNVCIKMYLNVYINLHIFQGSEIPPEGKT